MIAEYQVCGALLCVQDFIGSPHFSQRFLFSDYSVAILSEFAAISDSITTTAVCESWANVENRRSLTWFPKSDRVLIGLWIAEARSKAHEDNAMRLLVSSHHQKTKRPGQGSVYSI